MILTNYITAVVLMTLGLYVLCFQRDLIKMVVGLGILDYGVNLLIVSIGYRPGGTAPLFVEDEIRPGMHFVDPVPQALTLTSIVIGACVTAMALAIVVQLHRKYHTLDTGEIRRLRG